MSRFGKWKCGSLAPEAISSLVPLWAKLIVFDGSARVPALKRERMNTEGRWKYMVFGRRL